MRSNKWPRVAIVLGLAWSLAGCARDISVDFEPLSFPQEATNMSLAFERIQLEDGFAIAVVARPLDNLDKMSWKTQVELEASINGVFKVDRLDWDEEAESRKDYDLRDGDWNFVMWGVQPGLGTLEVYIDGEFETDIPVLVNAQPEGI